ncbi:MAG TPA: hypothetical protein VGK59_15060 [Ohtaekwangia sp.]
MAKVNFNRLFRDLKRYMIGYTFIRRKGEIEVKHMPRRAKAPATARVLKQRERFREAAKFARTLSDEQYAHYTKVAQRKKLKGAYQAAFADYLRNKAGSLATSP